MVLTVSFDNLNPEELQVAREQIAQYGQRAAEITQGLINSCVANDHHGGGRLVREMYDEPDLLMLVVGMLVTAVVKDVDAPMATPEQLGIDTEADSAVWQVAEIDQLQAAADENDVERFAKIALDAQVKSLTQDFRDYFAEHGHYPDMGNVMRGLLILDRGTLTVVLAEAITRLTMLEVGKEG